jgi:protease II
MNKPASALITAVPLAAVLAAPALVAQSGSDQPPAVRKVPHVIDIHGYRLTDDYFWLRQKTNPDVLAYLEAENAYTESVMKPTKALQETLYAEMLGRIKQTDLSVPSRNGEYFYYSRTEEGKQYPYMCRRKGSMDGPEEILLDLNTLAEGHKFLDFIDCAEFLVENKYTSSDRLVIQGGSAGGLLMGAVVNMRPDLFKASVAQVPFVDVINTMLDATLPLTTSEYTKWGNPNKKAEFDYMMKYSPYDNVKRQRSPSMLVHVSLNDSQVPYWEGAKFVAKLRVAKTDTNPLLLKTNMGAGLGGASGRYDALRETAFTYAYMLWQMGLTGGSATSDAAAR